LAYALTNADVIAYNQGCGALVKMKWLRLRSSLFS